MALVPALLPTTGCPPSSPGDAEAGPCLHVTCSDHGTCVVEGNEPVCDCQQGYVASGLNCLADPCDPNPCTEAPQPTCDDDLVRRTWPSPGECQAQAGGGAFCDYGEGETFDCGSTEMICVNGTCVEQNTSPPNPGDLVITEIMYNPLATDDETGEYIEIYNTTAHPVDLNGIVLRNQAQQSFTVTWAGPIMLDPGGYFLLGASQDLGSSGSVTVDMVVSDFTLSNSADGIIIEFEETIIDQVLYDIVQFPRAEGASLNLDPQSFSAQANDLGSSWCLSLASFGTGDLGTPKGPNTACANPCNPNPCTNPPEPYCQGNDLIQPAHATGLCTISGSDPVCSYGELTTDCTLTGQVCDDVANACTGGGEAPGPGDLVITEIMKNPDIIADDLGEWFEILNVSSSDIDLVGLLVTDDQANQFTVSSGGPLLIAPGEYFVFGRNDDPSTNGGVTVDYLYSYLMLNNGEDGLTLRYGGQVIDEVHYDGGVLFPNPAGASLSLDPQHLDASENDQGVYWCEAQTLYHPNNAGTPGLPNDSCQAQDPCDPNPCTSPPDPFCTGSVRTYPTLDPGTCTVQAGQPVCSYGVATQDCSASGLFCVFGQCVSARPPQEGELVITEIMKDPDTPIGDADGEWFEILNISSVDLDIQGLTVRDAGTDSFTLPAQGPIIVPASGYFVMGKSADTGLNGGVLVDYEYGNEMSLANADDEIILELGAVIIDQVFYDDGVAFPDPTGASINLDPQHLTASDNDTGSNWCEAVTSYHSANLGTPGAANDDCP